MRSARSRSSSTLAALALACCVLVSELLLVAGCGDGRPPVPQIGGDPERGRALVRAYGCATCHLVPGVIGARGLVGPPLEGFASRVYIAGTLPNTPDNLVRWIEDPRALAPRTAMPNVGVGEDDARDIAAYLYTLR